MLYLYHGTTSVCSVKVRLVFEEKGVAYDGELLDLRKGDQHKPDYVKINPNHVVPTLIDDGKIVLESTLIMEYLDDKYPSPPLMPHDPYQRAIARLWMKKIDDYLHADCSTLTFAIVFRPVFQALDKAERERRLAAVPDAAKRERQRVAIDFGIEAPHVAPAARSHEKFFGQMEEALSRAPYLAGDEYSLADAAVTPYVFRAEKLGLEKLWQGRRPHVADWYARIKARPSFEKAVTKWLTETDLKRYAAKEDPWPTFSAIVGQS